MATTTTTKCTRCGRALRSAQSIADGMGRTCKAKVAAATVTVAAVYKPAQVAKAAELVELAAIVREGARRSTSFRAVSSRGDAVYAVDQAAHSCTCPAGEKGVACYHLAAADMLTAA